MAIIIGGIILGGLLLMSGMNHFTKMEKMIEYSKIKKVPMPGLAVSFTGLMLMFSGVIIIGWGFGWWPVMIGPALIILAIFLFFTTMMMHTFWKAAPEKQMNEMRFFMRNMMLLGAILVILGLI